MNMTVLVDRAGENHRRDTGYVPHRRHRSGSTHVCAILGFFEAVVYICAVAKVLLNMDHPVYALAYGLGFASGTFLGITIEQRLAFGQQLATLVTRKVAELARILRAAGYRLAEVKGHTRDGDLTILYAEIPRRVPKS
jgi:uncharacterized protein YebE (UPF0316 family)